MANFYCETPDSGEPPCAGVLALRERIADLEYKLAEVNAERDALKTVLIEIRAWRRSSIGLEPQPKTDPDTLGARIDAAITDSK